VSEPLPDGWRAGTPRGDTLLRAYAEAFADLNEKLAKAAGYETVRTPDFAACDAHMPFAFSNAAVLLRPIHEPDDPVIDALAAFFAPDDERTPFLVWSATPTPSFAGRGWSLIGHPPLMLRPALPAQPAAPDGISIVEVTTAEQLAVFDATVVEAFPVPEMAGRRMFPDGVLAAPGWRTWLGLMDGKPVGTAAAHVSDAFVDVGWISTHPDARGRGVGEAMTWTATLAAPEKPAMLFASDLGRPVYERMGYLNLARLTLWAGARA
jgi:GNAT superfamily N-acetyltransferase